MLDLSPEARDALIGPMISPPEDFGFLEPRPPGRIIIELKRVGYLGHDGWFTGEGMAARRALLEFRENMGDER